MPRTDWNWIKLKHEERRWHVWLSRQFGGGEISLMPHNCLNKRHGTLWRYMRKLDPLHTLSRGDSQMKTTELITKINNIAAEDIGRIFTSDGEKALDGLLDPLVREIADQDDFMAMMHEDLEAIASRYDIRTDATPPMMWPELIRAVIAKAVKDSAPIEQPNATQGNTETRT